MKIGVLKVGGGLLSSDEHEIDEQIEVVVSEVRRMLEFSDAVWMVQSATGGTTRKLDGLCDVAEKRDHPRGLEGLLEDAIDLVRHHEALGFGYPRLITMDPSSTEKSGRDIERALTSVLDKVWNSGDNNGQMRAFTQSMGERMAVELVMLPAFREAKIRAGHFRAIDHMSATLGTERLATKALVSVEEAKANMVGTVETLVTALADTTRGFPDSEGVAVPQVFLMEGFVGCRDGKVVTLGYDGSDTSAVVVAHAFDTEAVLLKDIKGELDFSSTEELLEQMIKVPGDKGKLVGVYALGLAVKHGVTIVLRDPRTGYEHRLEPRATRAKVINMT